MDRILISLKKENGPRASSAPALGLNTIIFKHVYWYMQQTQVSVYRTIGPLVNCSRSEGEMKGIDIRILTIGRFSSLQLGMWFQMSKGTICHIMSCCQNTSTKIELNACFLHVISPYFRGIFLFLS